MLSDGTIKTYWRNQLDTFPLHRLNRLNLPDNVKQFLLQIGIPSKRVEPTNYHPVFDMPIQGIDQQSFFPVLKVKEANLWSRLFDTLFYELKM